MPYVPVVNSVGRADAIGVNVHSQKWFAYILAGVFGGLAGVLMLYQRGGAFPGYMDLSVSLDVYIMALLGGLQSLDGPIIGAVIYVLLKTILQTRFEHWNFILGTSLILIALFLPRGISGLMSDIRVWRSRRKPRRSVTSSAKMVAMPPGVADLRQ